MTLDEAIERYINNAEYERTHGSLQGCMEFRQLAEWLKDYKRLLEQEPKIGHCKDCKWWKDSDGVFRRGIGAESQCPMNRIEVYEGNGYCNMFEPQEGANE